MVLDLTKETFDAEVLANDGLVLVDMYATWCGPCKMIAPHVEAVAEENPTVKVCRLDVDRAGEVAMRYGVMSIPTLLFFKGGTLVETVVGYRTKDQLTAILEGHL